MDKDELSEALVIWFKQFITKNFKDSYDVLDVLIPKQQLSKINHPLIKKMDDYSTWEFKPDVLAILKSKPKNTISLAFINRTTSSISLKEIGELYCFAKLASVEFAFLASLTGVSNEVNILLVENEIRRSVLEYKNNSSICIFTLNNASARVNKSTVLPLEMRKYFD